MYEQHKWSQLSNKRHINRWVGNEFGYGKNGGSMFKTLLWNSGEYNKKLKLKITKRMEAHAQKNVDSKKRSMSDLDKDDNI